MQIYSAHSHTAQATNSLAVENHGRVNAQGDRLVVQREQERANRESTGQTQKARFDVDEQAIALVEQEQQLFRGNRQASDSTTAYDQPSQANQTAVSTYQSVDTLAQRETISQTFGVDLYA